jgi:tRNA (guanine10-N2)-dimethyltransferase
MKRIFLLSKENLSLAKAEVLALAGKKSCRMNENILILDTDFDFSRLAMTRKVYQHLFECSIADLEKKMAGFDWAAVYKKDFAVRVLGPGLSEKKLAGFIWNAVKKPKVNLSKPKTSIDIIIEGKKAFVGRLIIDVSHDFASRKPSVRPEQHPTTLNPKLALACVNLTGVPDKAKILDPFCGIGGFLIEAGLIGLDVVGYDISENMLDMCRKNLEFYKVKDFRLHKKDATKLSGNIDYLVTDLPYGISSLVTDNLESLYSNFLKALYKSLKCRAVVIFPDFVDRKKLLKKTKFKVEHVFNIYVHKSLSRNIVILSK